MLLGSGEQLMVGTISRKGEEVCFRIANPTCRLERWISDKIKKCGQKKPHYQSATCADSAAELFLLNDHPAIHLHRSAFEHQDVNPTSCLAQVHFGA